MSHLKEPPAKPVKLDSVAAALAADRPVRCSACKVKAVFNEASNRYDRDWLYFESADPRRLLCPKCVKGVILRVQTVTLYPLTEADAASKNALRDLLWDTTRAINVCLQEISRKDPVPGADISEKKGRVRPKLQKFSSVCDGSWRAQMRDKLYQLFPTLDSIAVNGIIDNAITMYVKDRYKILVSCDARMPRASYPFPLPLGSRSYRLYEEAGVPCVKIKIGRTDYNFRIKRGRLAGTGVLNVESYIRGLAKPFDLRETVTGFRNMNLTLRRVRGDDHRPTVSVRDESGAKYKTRITAHISMYLPKVKQKLGRSWMLIQPDEHCLLKWSVGSGRFYRLSGDKIRKLTAEARSTEERRAKNEGKLFPSEALALKKSMDGEVKNYTHRNRSAHGDIRFGERRIARVLKINRRRNQDFHDDRKQGLREKASNFDVPRQAASDKFNATTTTYTEQLASNIVKKAIHLNCKKIYWVDGASMFQATGFPWDKLRKCLEKNCEKHGIVFQQATDEMLENVREHIKEEMAVDE